MNLESTVLQVHIEDIIPNRFQPRLNFDEQGLKELSDSIREHGIIQPLVLRKLGDKYEIIAGERRYKAAQMAGLSTVPAVVANIDDNKSAEVALVENVQRRDLTPIEEARSYKNLLDKGYLTQEQLAKRMGLSQPAVANKLRLLNLDEEVQQALLEEKISERHARTLLSLPDKAAQREWLHRIINERLTVRQLDLELKKLRDSGEIADDSGGDVPLVSSTPSIEDIKANAVDISVANKMSNQEQNNQPIETLDTLEEQTAPQIEQPISPSPFPTYTQPTENIQNSFTTATTIPEFNIATPNSASTFVSSENLSNSLNDNKFFNQNQQDSTNNMNLQGMAPQSNQNNNFEVFDAPTMNNSFVDLNNSTEIPTFQNPTTIPKPEIKPNLNTFTNQPNINQNLDLNPNNKFFTPISEPPKEITINTQENLVDPMDSVEKLTPEYKEQQVENKEKGLKDAISTVRTCIEGLGNQGFFIDVEEIDFDSYYQITLHIHKD